MLPGFKVVDATGALIGQLIETDYGSGGGFVFVMVRLDGSSYRTALSYNGFFTDDWTSQSYFTYWSNSDCTGTVYKRADIVPIARAVSYGTPVDNRSTNVKLVYPARPFSAVAVRSWKREGEPDCKIYDIAVQIFGGIQTEKDFTSYQAPFSVE
jgi:hypothetical protein